MQTDISWTTCWKEKDFCILMLFNVLYVKYRFDSYERENHHLIKELCVLKYSQFLFILFLIATHVYIVWNFTKKNNNNKVILTYKKF